MSSFDYCILGAGIAGLSLADSLQEHGCRICVIDKAGIASGASGAPLGLINPATGRTAARTWRAEQCYNAIVANLKKVSSFSDQPFYKQNGILRPGLTANIARKMKGQFKNTGWPGGWCEWLSEEEVNARHPGIQCVNGGLWIPIGMTVDVAAYLIALAAYLSSGKVEIITKAGLELEQQKDFWIIRRSGQTVRCGHLIFATGYETTQQPWWNDLPLHPIKGQVAVFQPEAPLNFEHSVSSLGYIARLDDNEFVCGSTYEHDFDSVEPNTPGEEYLRKRLKRTLPDLERKSKLIRQWAGVRISSPNRKPVLGRHKKLNNLFIFTALGSKGLLYGKFLANHFANHLVKGTPLFKAVSVERFYSN